LKKSKAKNVQSRVTKLAIDNHYRALGLFGGFDSIWNIYKGLGLFSYATAALLYGESSETTKQNFIRMSHFSPSPFKQNLTAGNSTHAVKGVFEIALGLKWETSFYKDWNLLLRAGYEFFYWPNVTQKTISQQQRTRDRADLSYQGLIAGAKIDF